MPLSSGRTPLNRSNSGDDSTANLTTTTTLPPATMTAVATSAAEDNSPSYFSRDYWLELFDHQRLERLQQCQVLSKILQQCDRDNHSNANNNSNDSPETRVAVLDEVGPGIRVLKYYDWRDRIVVNQPGCIPELHSVWTCRAVSLGCGKALGQLKHCFDQQPMEEILSQPQTAYEEKSYSKINSANSKIPCEEFQRAVGQCVAEGATRLEESQRKHKRLS